MTWLDVLQAIRDVLDVRLFEIGGTSVTVSSLVTFVLIVIVSFWISWLVQRIIGRGMLRGGLSERSTVALVQRGIHYLVLVAGVAVALQTIGISLTTVFITLIATSAVKRSGCSSIACHVTMAPQS